MPFITPDRAGADAERGDTHYAITDLGSLPNVADDVALGLNASGQVSLWVGTTGQTVHAAVKGRGPARDLGSVPGHPNSVAHGISDRGVVVGWANTSQNPVDSLSTTHAFVCQGSRMQALGTLGGRDSRAFGVNAAGLVVGISDMAGGARHGFAFDGHTLTDLGTLPGGGFSQAYAVNAAGEIVGVSDLGRPVKHAVLWRGKTARTISDLGTLPGGRTSSARAINAKGEVAGASETPDGYHAFFYSGGRMQDLGTLGNDPSAADGINDRGQVVGASNVSAYRRHAFLWQNGHMTDLNTLVPPGGWVLTHAYAINNVGQIACTGQRRGGAAHALLLTPLPVRSP